MFKWRSSTRVPESMFVKAKNTHSVDLLTHTHSQENVLMTKQANSVALSEAGVRGRLFERRRRRSSFLFSTLFDLLLENVTLSKCFEEAEINSLAIKVIKMKSRVEKQTKR